MLEEMLYGLLREQGIWAVLFVVLLCYAFRKDEERDKQEAAREAAYQELLKQFAEELHVLREEKEKKNTVNRK